MTEFLRQRADSFDTRYNIKSTYEYGDSGLKNLIKFIGNVPIYASNRRKVR